MNLSKYEHAERKEAEASKDAPETPQDSGAEQKHHTLFGKQFTEKEQKTLFLYLVIGIVLMELAVTVGAIIISITNAQPSSSGVPHFQFPWIGYLVAVVMVPVLAMLLVNLVSLGFSRGARGGEDVNLEGVPQRMQTFYALVRGAPTVILFAGFVLDTKNLTMRTGGRTFEAAALLRRAGVDTADVQRLFQGTLSDMIERYDIIRHAELYHNDIAIAAVEQDIDRVTAAKAADELLTLRGVRASFVLFKHDTGVNLSARSLGEINVQLIMEKLGGGGNSTTAGGQIPDGTVDAVREQLIAAIDQYLEG